MKYPRTYHLPWSPGATRDDRIQKDLSHIIGKEIVITEKIDGCFTNMSIVSMADGSKKKISQINVGDEVLGVRDNKIIPSKVLETFNHGPAGIEGWVMVRGKRRGAGRGNNFFSIKCTSGHLIWCSSEDKYKEASALSRGDKVLLHRSEMGLTPIQEQVLLGKMLGDGSLNQIENSAHISWNHKMDDHDYVKWTCDAIGDIDSGKLDGIKSGYGSDMIRARTTNQKHIKDKFSSFIKNGKKIVPQWVEKELSPIAIAFWFMDDGSVLNSSSQNERAHFATCSFSKRDCVVLQSGLKKFDINARIFKSKGYFNIDLNCDEADKLFLLIAPYIPPSMQRKLPIRYRGGPGWIPKKESTYKPLLVEQEIVSVTKSNPRSNRFDIATETNNYFVSGVLVHNSNVCLSHEGVYARSHSGPPTHASFDLLKARHAALSGIGPIAGDPFGIQIFAEWCYAKHSIHYLELPDYLLAFGIRDPNDNIWYSWKWFVHECENLDLTTAPVLYTGTAGSEKELKKLVENLAAQPSVCGGEREGVVVRAANSFYDEQFSTHVLKWVRKDHVQTDVHWKNQEIVKNVLKES